MVLIVLMVVGADDPGQRTRQNPGAVNWRPAANPLYHAIESDKRGTDLNAKAFCVRSQTFFAQARRQAVKWSANPVSRSVEGSEVVLGAREDVSAFPTFSVHQLTQRLFRGPKNLVTPHHQAFGVIRAAQSPIGHRHRRDCDDDVEGYDRAQDRQRPHQSGGALSIVVIFQ